jgi:hypothetical protein
MSGNINYMILIIYCYSHLRSDHDCHVGETECRLMQHTQLHSSRLTSISSLLGRTSVAKQKPSECQHVRLKMGHFSRYSLRDISDTLEISGLHSWQRETIRFFEAPNLASGCTKPPMQGVPVTLFHVINNEGCEPGCVLHVVSWLGMVTSYRHSSTCLQGVAND